MARGIWTAEDKQTVSQLRAEERSWEEIAKVVGRTSEACRKLYGEKRHIAPQNPQRLRKEISPGHAEQNEQKRKQALEMQQAAMELFQPPAITCLYDRDSETNRELKQEDLARKWADAEEKAVEHILKSQTENRFKASFYEDWVLICALSDLHIAPGTPVDFRRMRQDAELIRKTPRCYAMIGGDVVDNHIRIPPAILASRSTPEDQWKLYEHWLGIIGPKVACCIAGNHDEWTKQRAGVDMLGWIMGQQKVHYSKDEAWVECQVGNQSYTFAMRHQYRMNSSFNQTHAVKQWLKNGEGDFDIGVIGHHHEAAIESFLWHGKPRWAARPGAYQITSAYSRQYGWNDAIPTVPTFLLCGDERRVIGFADLRDALKFLKLA